MESVVFSLLAFIVAVSILVTAHEYGHFWVARRLGVKVLRFSIGFGPIIWRRTSRAGTEYALSLIPLGGYVKLLGEQREDLSPADLPHAFSQKSVGRRIAIVLAGPVANFLFAICALWIMYLVGPKNVLAYVNAVVPHSIAAKAGMHADETITAVNGEKTPALNRVWQVLAETSDRKKITFTAETANHASHTYQIILPEDLSLETPDVQLKAAGIKFQFPPIIGTLVANSPAEKGGLKPGDRVLRVNGDTVEDWGALVEKISKSPNKPLLLQVQRNNMHETITVVPESVDEMGQVRGLLGVYLPERFFTVERYHPGKAFEQAFKRTAFYTTITFKMLGKMIRGEASLSNVSGPVTIAQLAGQSAQSGFTYFVDFLALISVSLGILNILPIPLLDGGHLLYFVIEAIRGKPLTEFAEQLGMKIGLFILLFLTGLALYNDVARLMS